MSDDPDWLSDADQEELLRQQMYEERVAKAEAKRQRELAAGTAQAESADELSLRLLLLAALEGAVAQSIKRTKELLGGRLTLGDLKRPRIGNVSAGSVTYANGPASVNVTNEAELTAWVEQNYTTEIELITRIRPAFLEQIIEATRKAGEPCAPGGELDVPGLSVRDGRPRIVARPDRAHASELWLAARADPLRLISAQEPRK